MNKIYYQVSDIYNKCDPNNTFFHSKLLASIYNVNIVSNRVSDPIINSKKELENLSDYSNIKYKKYIIILANRLNDVHGSSFPLEFWKVAISLGLFRQIALIHQFFYQMEQSFDPNKHDCRVLSSLSYYIPHTFEEQREFLSSSWKGQEQLLSHYINYFYPKLFKEIHCNLSKKSNGILRMLSFDFFGILKKYFSYLMRVFVKMVRENKFKAYFLKLIKLFIKLFSQDIHKSKVKLLIIGSFFSPKYLELLFSKSNNRISLVPLPKLKKSSKTCISMRDKLSVIDASMDRFDEFFFSSLKYLFPRYLLEDFMPTADLMRNDLEKYKNLKYICSEAWLSSSEINLYRAFAKQNKGVETLYNEHNCIFHPFVGSPVQIESELVDKYLTFGWQCEDAKFYAASSLFPFSISMRKTKYDILYISYSIEEVMSFYCSNYSIQGDLGIKYLECVRKLFHNLDSKILQNINYRGYPKDYCVTGLRFDKEKFLEKYLKRVNMVSSFKNKGETCKEQIAQSNIVVVDFLSTAYLEALHMNVPTIVLWPPEIMSLDDKFSDFFDNLIDAKIMHTSPITAAEHLMDVYENPNLWWNEKKTQDLKDAWLSRNFGKPEILLNYLLDLAKSQNVI